MTHRPRRVPTPRALRSRRTALIVGSLVPLALIASCQQGQSMWGPCSSANGGDRSGTDGTYVLVCESGEWVPVMTNAEYVAISRGQQVTVAPLPQRPTTTTTTTTTSTSTTAPSNT